MSTEPVEHPYAYTADEMAFLRRIDRIPIPIPSGVPLSDEDFDRLHELLGRYPDYDPETGEPIALNSRFQNEELARLGIENLICRGKTYVRTTTPTE